MFYNLLVKDTLEAEPSESLPPVGDQVDMGGSVNDLGLDLENSKTAIEVSQSFADSSSYYIR